MCVRPRVSRGSMLGLSLPSLAAQRDLRVRVRVLARARNAAVETRGRLGGAAQKRMLAEQGIVAGPCQCC